MLIGKIFCVQLTLAGLGNIELHFAMQLPIIPIPRTDSSYEHNRGRCSRAFHLRRGVGDGIADDVCIITWAGGYCLVKGGQYIFHDQGGIMEIMPPMGGIIGRHHGKYAAHGRHHGNYAAHGRHHGNYAAHGRHNFHDAALANPNISPSM